MGVLAYFKMNIDLIDGAYLTFYYLIGTQTYLVLMKTFLVYKEITRERPFSFLELFLYTEKNRDEDREAQEEKEKEMILNNFEASQRIMKQIKRIIEDEKHNED